MKRTVTAVLLILAAAGLVAAQCGQPTPAKKSGRAGGNSMSVSDAEIAAMYKHHYNRINEKFSTGGQPTVADLEQAKKDGFKTVINLQEPEEYRTIPEEATARRLGMRWYSIPVVYRQPTFDKVDEFLRVTDAAENQPTLVHCTMNIRAGAFFMIRRILRDGWTYEDALKEAERATTVAPHYQRFVRDYVAAHPKK